MELSGLDLKWPGRRSASGRCSRSCWRMPCTASCPAGRRARRRRSPTRARCTDLPEYRRALRRHRIRMVVLARRAPCSSAGRRSSALRARSTRRSTSRRHAAATSCCASTSPARWRPTTRRWCRPSRRSSKSFEGERIGARHLQQLGGDGLPAHRRLRLHQRRARLGGARAHRRPGHTTRSSPAPSTVAGTSLIGDGLATCVSSFDKVDLQRARSVVFATDNHLAGRPIIDRRRGGASWPGPRASASTGSTPRRTAPTRRPWRCERSSAAPADSTSR